MLASEMRGISCRDAMLASLVYFFAMQRREHQEMLGIRDAMHQRCDASETRASRLYSLERKRIGGSGISVQTLV